jgi:hypothetical protein
VSLFLSAEDLHDLTGMVRADAQRRWLIERGYRFEVRGDGRPAVMVDEVKARLVSGGNRRTSGPDLKALDECG